MGFWEYCFNKRLEHYYFFFIYTCFLQFVYARIGVIVGEDSLLWRVSSHPAAKANSSCCKIRVNFAARDAVAWKPYSVPLFDLQCLYTNYKYQTRPKRRSTKKYNFSYYLNRVLEACKNFTQLSTGKIKSPKHSIPSPS